MSRRQASLGFTMLEMVVVVLVAGVLIGIASRPLAVYNQRVAARRAAEVFSRDLTLARAMSLRTRETVTVKFNETGRWYSVRTATGRELATRRYATGQELTLSSLDLDLTGDSIAFSSRGVGNLSTALGAATFTAGTVSYRVQFNPMGASKVGPL